MPAGQDATVRLQHAKRTREAPEAAAGRPGGAGGEGSPGEAQAEGGERDALSPTLTASTRPGLPAAFTRPQRSPP
jgi:hypothetical protein